MKEVYINKKTKNYHPFSFLIRIAVYISALITIGTILFLLGYIFINGIPHLKMELFQLENTTSNNSMLPAIINTFLLLGITLLLSVPLGVSSAIYMVEYAKKNNLFIRLIRLTTETLAGIPSIVYGLFGYLAFVITLGWHNSLIAGAVTMAIMVLPLIIRTTEEALLSVPDSFREGSYGLGAGKLRTIFTIILPSALPGILAGAILSAGRIIGETAALIFTAGTISEVPSSPFAPAATLSVHMYSLLNEGLHTEEAYSAAVVLIILIFIINCLINTIKHRKER